MEDRKSLFELIKTSIWKSKVSVRIGELEYNELKEHAIIALPANYIYSLAISDELKERWQKDILQQIAYYAKYKYQQERLPITVPYVILKGTSAAQYYPSPEYRTMGDIDVMTRHEDYEAACSDLILNGYNEKMNKAEEEFGRHRGFFNNGIEVEVHSFFSLRNDPGHAEYLDNLIIDNINPSHVLPDLINGLVLLAHIDQHMERGLGLRHIIDWMMFVDKCLPDEKWPEFQQMAHNIGLEILAVVTTRMCEIYLGLPTHNWCKNADPELCEKLMDYVMSCGNFGSKRSADGPVANLLMYTRTPGAVYRLLQERGLVNWKLARKYKFLRPFAWIYQSCRYLWNGIERKNTFKKLKVEINEANERVVLFDELGVKQTSKGLAVYKDGRYVKTFNRP